MDESGFFPLKTLAIVGMGLIGGSLALAARSQGLADRILGYDADPRHCKLARSRKLADHVHSAPDSCLEDADWLVLAVPVKANEAVLNKFLPFLSRKILVTDTGSVKAPLLRLMQSEALQHLSFVGGHPIAGSERFGPDTAQPALFAGKRFIVTPEKRTPPEVLRKVKAFWTQLGSEVLEMDAEVHDRVFASVSHLPHLLAYATIQTIADSDNPEALGHSGAGLKDFSRIASSSPEMWADIFLENQTNLLKRVRALTSRLGDLEDAVKHGDRDRLIELLARAKSERDRWVK